MARKHTRRLHPIAAYGKRQAWNAAQTASFFGLRKPRYYQLVGAHNSTTYERACDWERRTRGEVRAVDVLAWQLEYAKKGGAGTTNRRGIDPAGAAA